MENTVDMMQPMNVQDDAAQVQGEALSTIIEETQAQANPEAPEQRKEPGYIKQRVNAAVTKAVAEAEARIRAEYETMLAPIRESVLERQANDLVAQGEFKSLERAKEYLRLKGGMPTEAPAQEKPAQPNRDAQGRFAPAAENGGEGDAVTRARADLLAKQAQKIKGTRGVDVMQMFNADDAVKQRVLSGEWDFYDVAEQMQATRSVPSPMRTPNGSSVSGVSIANMTDEQFERLQANLAAGRTYDMRK